MSNGGAIAAQGAAAAVRGKEEKARRHSMGRKHGVCEAGRKAKTNLGLLLLAELEDLAATDAAEGDHTCARTLRQKTLERLGRGQSGGADTACAKMCGNLTWM
jgi:hypothetical protein